VIKSRKRVLIITYYFPPSGGSGVQRTLKFIKHLRNFGWEPIVLTALNADYPAYDESLWEDVPKDMKIYRSKIFEPYRLYRRFTGKKIDDSTDISTLTLDETEKHNFNERISELIRAFFFIPDARILWLPFSLYLGFKILRKEKIDLIFSSAPPYTTHLIGMLLHRFSKIPWIADFRDSWIGWLSTPQWRPNLSRAFEFWMEGSVLRYANCVITVSKGVRDDLLSRNPSSNKDKWYFLPNGYDATDFLDVKPYPKNNKLTFVYSGSLYGNRNPEYLIRALERLKLERLDLYNFIHFRFVGRIGQSILDRIQSSSVNSIIDQIIYVKHKESISYLKSSDISLLIIDDAPVNKGILTGKLYEYIGVGHPIFALAPNGDAADLINKYQLGQVVSPKNIKKIFDALIKIIEEHNEKRSSFCFDDSVRKKFERKEQTKKLAEIFTNTMSGN